MYELALIIAIIASFYAGVRYRDLKTSISNLVSTIKEKVDKEKPQENTSSILDPYDPVNKAIEEHEEMMRKLNNQ